MTRFRSFSPSLTRRLFLGATGSAAGLGLVAGLRPGAASAQAAPQQGGVLRVGVVGTGAFGGFDAHVLMGDILQTVAVTGNIFETLTTVGADGLLSNVLAESITPDDDTAVLWTIRIKPGVTFHNGNPLTADDVIFSLQRMTEPGSLTGGNVGPVETYERVDDLTVRLTLGAPRSWLPEGLSDPYSGIVPVGFDPAAPVGTGPLKMGATNLQQSATFERYDGYHGTPSVVDSVELLLFADPAAAANALTSGQIDLYPALESYLVGELEGNADIGIYESPTGRFFPIQMRTDVAPFDDPRFRQALRLVIDRNAVINSAFGGYAQKGNDLYAIYDRDYAADLMREQDVETARRLIEEAGLVGTEVDLEMFVDMSTALILAENAKEIGVTINVRQLDGATFYGEEYFNRAFFGGDYYPNAPYFVTSALCDGPNPSLDQVRWRDEEYLALWLEASGTVDPDLRREKLLRMQEILFEKGAWIIAAFPSELAAYSATLTGLPESEPSGWGIYRALSRIGFAA